VSEPQMISQEMI